MLIQGSSCSDRTDKLIEYYNSLVERGVSPANILVLCLNSFKKKIFIDKFKSKTLVSFYEEPKIYTFYGLVYNSIIDNWPMIENSISIGKRSALPNMTGLEISQLFFKSAVKEVGFADYNSKVNLIHQLFRRYSLIANNNLSEEAVRWRSELLSESFGNDAQKTIDIYKRKTLEFRAFDYIRQLGLFDYIVNKSDYFNSINYLIVDDADEITPFEFDFIKRLYPSLKDVCIGYDANGTSRMGFLNADVNTVIELEKFFVNEQKINLDNIDYSPIKAKQFSYTRRLEMLNSVLSSVVELINGGVHPSDIAIITPLNDKSLKALVDEIFSRHEISCQYLSGNEKLVATQLVKNIISVLKLSLGVEIDVYEYRCILTGLLKIPLKYCMQLVVAYKNSRDVLTVGLNIESYKKTMDLFVSVLQEISVPNRLLSERIFCIFKKLVKIDKTILSQMNTFAFFMKQILDFETVFIEHKTNVVFQKNFLIQLENSIISENPSGAIEIDSDSVVISTVQKVIDLSLKTRYQFWLDVSSNEWTKDDLGTIYNAWVFQKSWNKDDFTYEDNLLFSTLKIKKQLRKLALLTEEIYAYSSFFDVEGNENIGGILEYFEKPVNQVEQVDRYCFIPRDDQKPVLEYSTGNMAISAVPGAGKTTVLLALIIKLLQKGVNSENIFVLTYMESAARNFKERIKTALPDLDRVPNISTIHGLALRILKENSNHIRVGLDVNFDVCDDNTRQKFIREAISKLNLNQEDYDKYEKGISSLKLSGSKKIQFVKDSELRKFLKLFHFYNNSLKSQNFIDYDDMLLMSVELLENNTDILGYYRDICHYVIEDEAQDSSFIQQKLLMLLSGKHNNLIRCGDINQSITTTFTNSDLDGFRKFIDDSFSVSMNMSQRCAKDIFGLANKLIDFSNSSECLKNSFYNIKMQAVEGKNPISENAVEFQLFDDYKAEQAFMLKKIREVFLKDDSSTVAILVRNNFQIADYSQFLTENGYSVITRNDTLDAQPVFALLCSVLSFYAHPWDNATVLNVLDVLNRQGLNSFSFKDIEFIKNLKTPFILQDEQYLNSNKLVQLLWDLNYWLCNPIEDLEAFVVKIGSYYYNTEIEKSNVYMVALLFKNLNLQYKSLDTILEKVLELSSKPVLSKYKFFENPEEQMKTKGSVQIMTYHKSKGDEFDCVFIPQLSEENLPFDLNNVKIKSKERFWESVKALNLKYKRKDEQALKKFYVEENLRLLYVAITRAKKNLYITCSCKYKKFAKTKTVQPSLFFDVNQSMGVANDI